MKNLVVLTIVLLLSSIGFCAASLDVYINGSAWNGMDDAVIGDTITFKFTNDGALGNFGTDFVAQASGQASYKAGTYEAAATSLGFFGTLTFTDLGNGAMVEGPQTFGLADPLLADGSLFKFDLSADAIGAIDFSATGIFNSLPTDIAGRINIIPEPMTVLLLGMGGLFLRRRK